MNQNLVQFTPVSSHGEARMSNRALDVSAHVIEYCTVAGFSDGSAVNRLPLFAKNVSAAS